MLISMNLQQFIIKEQSRYLINRNSKANAINNSNRNKYLCPALNENAKFKLLRDVNYFVI